MSEDKKSLINLVPEAIDNAAKNLTDKSTQNIGTTISDICYLVFGGISQTAEMRKLKYSYALKEFERELQEKTSKIPEENRVEPDMQVVSQAFEALKYCVEKEELRHMFSSLIASSLDKNENVSPVIAQIVSSLSSIDAKILNYFYTTSKIDIDDLFQTLNLKDNCDNCNNVYFSLMELQHLNLIYSYEKPKNKDIESQNNAAFNYMNINGIDTSLSCTKLTMLRYKICEICLK